MWQLDLKGTSATISAMVNHEHAAENTNLVKQLTAELIAQHLQCMVTVKLEPGSKVADVYICLERDPYRATFVRYHVDLAKGVDSFIDNFDEGWWINQAGTPPFMVRKRK